MRGPAPLVGAAPPAFRRVMQEAFGAATVGDAFLVGYRAAVSTLSPTAGALAATEQGPLHPARVRTQLREGSVTGTKSFVTGVPGIERVLVLAEAGADGDRLVLVVAEVAMDAVGITVTAQPPLPFVPEVGHAVVSFAQTPVVRVLPGDGWTDWVRPFRTIEDIHVLGAVSAWLLGVSERGELSRPVVTSLLGTCAALGALAGADPSSPTTHLALAGVWDESRRTADALRFADPDLARSWARDLPLLTLADRARTQRLDAAWVPRSSTQ